MIQEAEDKLQLSFAEEYQEYLREFGFVSFGTHELTGITDFHRLNVTDVTTKQRNKNPNVPLPFYVVEETNIDGIVIWQCATGEVFQTRDNGRPFLICKTLAEFIEAT